MISAVIRNEQQPTGNADKRATRTAVGHSSVKSLEIGGLTRNSSPTNPQSVAKSVGFTWGAAQMPVMESKDASSEPDKGMDANYNRALNLLKSNPPEGRLDIQLPHAKYLQLEKAFFKLYPESLELRYPSLSYDSFTETVTVVTCPANIHESAALDICPKIVEYARAYLSTYGRESAIQYYGSTTTDDFEGEFEGSTKQPDGGVRYSYLDGNKVTVVLEAGFSEDYNSLCRSKNLWIDGHGVNVYILLCLTEKPRFKNPTTEYSDIGDVKAAIDLMESSMNETLGLNLSNNRHTLFLYRGHKWAGELKDVFIEIWRAGTSIASRYYLVQDGRTCDDLPTTLGIKIIDLFPDNAWRAAHIPDKVIPFNATVYVQTLMGAMRSTAEDRFKKFIKKGRGRRGEGGGRGGRGSGSTAGHE
ncbi:hypothetical protein POJ06DRAFT_299584 [Lipomyces tetrasporus]|uniref:Uncharacterized protein n=1 Tax=Lipomyces tetrasporus TaxID=54092 RepID=A0AAD7QXK8_9ASCO|nr:uncharacterized protein POJ06DRAFT_299584 [Lipomyces tetrasporus]KAJ8103339.1 hypothetical protein POJ06DRAFT_299584 [Lipomyces tetrasporus]